jgi:hypothetical protein
MTTKATNKNKTVPTTVSADDFLASQAFSEQEHAAAQSLITLFEQVTGKSCVMWGKIFGFGQYHYQGRSSEGEWMATGFALRKNAITLYIMCGFSGAVAPLLEDLGKYKISGGSCLYIRKLADVDMAILEKIIKTGLDELTKGHDIQ